MTNRECYCDWMSSEVDSKTLAKGLCHFFIETYCEKCPVYKDFDPDKFDRCRERLADWLDAEHVDDENN